MRKRIALATLGTGAVIIAIGQMEVGAVPAAPAGAGGADLCENATPITVGSYAGSTIGADSDGEASCGASADSPDVWYRYTADEHGVVTVSTCASGFYDTVLSLHTGCPGTSANMVSCNDDTCGLRSTVTAILDDGESILVRVSGYDGASGDFDLEVSFEPSPPSSPGPDVLYSDCTGVAEWGAVGGVRAYSLGTSTCNIGDQNLLWGGAHDGTPVIGMNAYRLEDGRLMQIGLSFAKHGTGAAAGPGCGLPCNGEGGSVLGVGCRDVYSAGFNGGQGILGPRSEVNAFTGVLAPSPGGSGDAIFRRLQIAEADLDPASHGDALYFVEGVYVASDDAGMLANSDNNASHRRVEITGDFEMDVTDFMQPGVPAIQAWRDHGGGLGVPDPSVELQIVDVPGEGRFHVASKVVDLGADSWRYEYAIFNLSSDRSAGSFTVPIASGAGVSDVGFHDVDYHSGEVYDNTDWGSVVSAGAVAWSSPDGHTANPNSNALRWGTMYNFWFTAELPPVDVPARLGLFKPGVPSFVTVAVPGPGVALPCPEDLNGNGAVDFADILAIIGAWGPCVACPEDLDGSGDVGFGDILSVIAAWGDCP
ncbi:MAG: hypothetical protein ACYTGP_04450 [Planctomycetota bacterium]|jgi:hypothetical protein